MADIQLMQDFSEMVNYETAGLPLYIRRARLSVYPGLAAPCHWHDDLEWIQVLEGNMRYDINGRRILLRPGDILLVNARQMHYGYSYEGEECLFYCILFHPSLFGENEVLRTRYVTPVLYNAGLPFLHLRAGEEACRRAAAHLERMVRLKEEAGEGYELSAIAAMMTLWEELYRRGLLTPRQQDGAETDDLKLQKAMVSYIYQHYPEPLTLESIAEAGHVSRSKCCRIFQRYMQQSPVDFLNACRLKASCRLLQDSDTSVTEIAYGCGFHHLSYFSKSFKKAYGVSPREFRGGVRS